MDDERKLTYEIGVLLAKVTASEEVVHTAELYFEEKHKHWRLEIEGRFLDLLEKKRTQIDYDWHRIRRLGEAIASGRAEWWVNSGHSEIDL